MNLLARIETAFAGRRRPAMVAEIDERRLADPDIQDALWFTGRDWREIRWDDWQQRHAAIFFMNPDALRYFLPGILVRSLERPGEALMPAEGILSELDRSPAVELWDPFFMRRYLGLSVVEYHVLRKWLLRICEMDVYRGRGSEGSGGGETFGRAYETVHLLEEMTERGQLPPEVRPVKFAEPEISADGLKLL